MMMRVWGGREGGIFFVGTLGISHRIDSKRLCGLDCHGAYMCTCRPRCVCALR